MRAQIQGPLQGLTTSRALKKWSGASYEEARRAISLSGRIRPSKDKVKQGKELLRLALELIETEAATLFKANAVEENEISSNLISQIAYEVENRDSDIKLSGSYFTPYVLALDMARHAHSKWLEINSGTSSYPVWYDPCAGGGVFPVAIAELLLSQGKSSEEVIKSIKAVDINPLFVEASKIRLGLVLSKNKKDFVRFYHALSESVVCEDALLSHSEKTSIFGSTKPSVDIVIGNPPYVRSNSISANYKETLNNLYPSVWSGTADLYMFFIAHGLNALKKGGVLCYISPATFQRTASGAPVRSYIEHNASIDFIFDFDELNVFENVSSHLSVYLLSKSRQADNTAYCLFSSLPSEQPLSQGLEGASWLRVENKNGTPWTLHIGPSALSYIEKDAISLASYTNGIYSGVKTGLKHAYELNTVDHAEILEDEKSQPYIFPLLRPRQIERWNINWQNTFQIVVKKGESLDPDSKVYEHLLNFREALTKRADLRDKEAWYSLRDCAYFHLFPLHKIVYRDISAKSRFAMDTGGMLVVDGGFFIPQEDYFLLGLLNSKVGSYYFRNRCATIGSVGSRARLRFKKTYVSGFPIPTQIDPKIKEKIAFLAKKLSRGDNEEVERLEAEIDELVFELYRLPSEFRDTVMNS